ncbi:MAG: hypothetical protein CMD02_02930 [Flavobacteriales bacterium]|nr:hypothetical protein [Flavobacteriales bacterium]|tara:strand:- start:75 stop:971 length:897 start_codon:yes stop_codon:yes gene_type:complete
MNLKGILQDKSESLKLWYFVLLVFISSFIGIIFSSIMSPAEADIFLEENKNKLKISQFIASVFVFIIPCILFSYFSSKDSLNVFGFRSRLKRQNILLILFMIIFIQPFVVFCMQLNTIFLHSVSEYIPVIYSQMELMEDKAAELTNFFLSMNSVWDLILNLFLIALIPAIGEELFFRGIIQKKLSNILKSTHLSVIITSCIFSAIHMQFFGFLPRLLLGIILGYLFVYSRNLCTSILAHFINNALGVLLMFSAFSDNLNTDITNLENTEISFLQAFFSVSVVLLFFYLYIKVNNPKSD